MVEADELLEVQVEFYFGRSDHAWDTVTTVLTVPADIDELALHERFDSWSYAYFETPENAGKIAFYGLHTWHWIDSEEETQP